MTPDQVRAFLAPRTEQLGDCLLWTKATNSAGAPVASIEGVRARAVRRWVWECFHPGYVLGVRRIVPICGDSLCLEPGHQASRSPSDVNKMIAARGGFSTVARRVACRRSGRALSPLTIDDVRAIRARRAGGEKLASITADYPVDLSAIARICRGESWHDAANPFAGLLAA